MTQKELAEKFDAGRSDNTLRRIDNIHPLDIFVGYIENRAALFVLGLEKHTIIKSTCIIKVILEKKKDYETRLYFVLMDQSYYSLFLKLCEDLIESSRNIDNAMVINHMINRWGYWKNMFYGKQKNLLSDAEIKGLLGELIFMNTMLIPQIGTESAIQSWMGPDKGHKDFEMFDTWQEIKAIASGASSVKINSKEQLDSSVIGHLVILQLDKTNLENKRALDLHHYILSIIDQIEKPAVLNIFEEKLANYGYQTDERYERKCYQFKGIKCFIVNERFPRLTKDNIPDEIVKISYEIAISSIIQFEERKFCVESSRI